MFTRQQLEKLSEILYDYQDEGPTGEGWASKELVGLRDAVDQALRDQEGFLPLPDRPISGWPLAFPFAEGKGLL